MILTEIAGHLGADAEERFTGTGKRVVTLRVATRIRQSGNDETVWWRVNIWSDRFDRLIPYLKKGSAVIIVGEMAKPETYVDRNGQTQISLTLTAEIVKFSPFGRQDRNQGQQEGGYQQQTSAPASAPAEEQPVAFGAGQQEYSGDDLPF